MNERINYLSKQAKEYTVNYEKEIYSRGYYHDDLNKVFNNKLVELVLKDCLAIVGDGTVDGEIYHARIKNHFNFK